mmetsp:Transcript_16866/g.29817  ORF Transcript_16866/g.29817 Transcript_16866/m.29817 type:complete len:435 (-) Transcript_16866:171-1475(-)
MPVAKRPQAFYGRDAPAPGDSLGHARKRRLADSLEVREGASFARQVDAFAFVDGLGPEEALSLGRGWTRPAVFAVEKAASGSRTFAALGKMDFAEAYLQVKPLKRHVYEIIRSEQPCRLYFDLEFAMNTNPDTDGEQLVQFVILATGTLLQRRFGILLERSHVLELDSSSPKKFSRHLIVHLPGGRLFRNNRVCGHFVKQVVELIRDRLIVLDKNHELTTFVDLGVYTRNRAFRLYLSSKFGKRQVLEPSTTNTFPYDDTTPEQTLTLLESSLVCPQLQPGKQAPTLLPFGEDITDATPLRSLSGPSSKPNASGLPIPGQRCSPFPQVEKAVLDFVMQASKPHGCLYPNVRAWSVTKSATDQSKTTHLTLHLAVNRFCHRIMRPHRSNNVLYIVDLQAGTFCQRCYDSDCAHWASSSWPIPETALREDAVGPSQ